MSSARTISVALASAFLFMALDLGIRFACPQSFGSQYDPVQKTDIGLKVNSYRDKRKAPDVVFIGSSVVIAGLTNASPGWLRSTWHNLSSPGQFVSDAYLISSCLFAGRDKPKLIVYGVAPRDFVDNNLQSPTTTDVFRYFGRARSPFSLPSSTYMKWDEWFAHAMSAGSWLCGNREMLAAAITDICQHGYTAPPPRVKVQEPPPVVATVSKPCAPAPQPKVSPLPAKPAPSPPAAASPPPPSAKIDKQEQARLVAMVAQGQHLTLAEKNRMLAGAKLPPKDSPEFRQYMLSAFSAAYRPFKEKTYRRQMNFLNEVLAFCRREEIPIVLVKMPLDQDNLALLPEGIYDRYNADVDRAGAKYNCTVLNFQDPRYFTSASFEDTVHLNAQGAETFRDLLVQRLSLIASSNRHLLQ